MIRLIRNTINNLGTASELLRFFWQRRLWWLIPMLILLLLLALLLVLASTSGLGPFVYTFF